MELFFKYKNILPYYTRPLPDELFSSWLIRCALKHNSNPQSFSKEVFKTNNIWNRDIDRSILLENLKYFSEINLTTYAEGLKSTFHKYENILFERLIIKSNCKFVLPQGIYHRTRSRPSLQYCPICLSKKTPYYKTIWRLAFFVCCPICKIKLHDKCPKCLSPVIPHRNFTKNADSGNIKSITQCYACDFNLTASPISYPDSEVYDLTLVFYKKIIRAGHNQFTINNDLLYFEGIRSIVFWLNPSNEKSCLISNSIFKNSMYYDVPLTIEKKNSLEFMDYSTRYKMIYNLAIVLNDWPNSITKISQTHKINYYEFNTYNNFNVPFWLFNLLKTRI